MADYTLEIQDIAIITQSGIRQKFPLVFPVPFGLQDIDLVQKHILSINDIALTITTDSIVLTQKHLLSIDSILHNILIDQIEISNIVGILGVTFDLKKPIANIAINKPELVLTINKPVVNFVLEGD